MWTNDQQNAIDAPVGNILVTAAAGSGKTAVMVERIINRLTGDNPVDADRILVVTFTNAAASEIKDRIMKGITSRLDKEKNPALKRQLVLINNASICTIHSFCLDVVRSNFNLADIDPNVRIGNASDLELMKQKALDYVLNEHYENDLDFIKLVKAYTKKNDSNLVSMITKLYDFSKSIPDGNKWLLSLGDSNADREFILNFLLKESKKLLKRALGLYDKILSLCNIENFIDYRNFFENERQHIEYALTVNSWDEMVEILDNAEAKRLVFGKNYEEFTREKIKSLRKTARDIVKDVSKSILNISYDKAMSDFNTEKFFIKKLAQLVVELDEEYSKAKKEKCVIDFSDFEHLCLGILNDNGVQSDAAKAIMNRFDEIYIDEYQDCNSIQEAIFSFISGENKGKPNIFAVGDMKQSIYKFRDANPKIFKSKSDMYPLYDKDNYAPSSKIILNANFRSRGEILSCINSLFSQIMTENVGELDYNKEQYLYFGSKSYTHTISDNKAVDVVMIEGSSVIDNDPDTELDELNVYGSERAEAVYICKRINEMINDPDYLVYDKKIDGYRHIEYRDIVILMRSARTHSQAFSDVFESAKIPLFTDVKGYFNSEEIDFLLNVLKVIDNPLDDISLVAVMHHPVFDFRENDLAHIRLNHKSGRFYNALVSASEIDDEVGRKSKKFLELLNTLYDYSKYMNVNEILTNIISLTDYMSYLCTLSNAQICKSNVKMLFNKAREFETNTFKGIFNFVNYIEMIKKKTGDSDSAKIIGENDNVVRIMTIHKSKGLEFPVVFLSKTASRFNKIDMNMPILLHKDFGIGLDVVNLDRRISYPSITKNAIKIAMKKELLSEELRILYVALTRAREKLIITSYMKDCNKKISDISEKIMGEGHILSENCTLDANSYLDWILMGILRNPSCQLADDLTEKIISDSIFNCERVYEGQLELEESSFGLDTHTGLHTDSPDENVILKMEFVYPFSDMTKIPRNISVSELKRMSIEEENAYTLYPQKMSKPEFLHSDTGLTGADRGTLIHFVMEKLDFTKTSLVEIKEQVDNLKKQGFISEIEYSTVDIDKIYKFFESDLGKAVSKHNHTFNREFSFKYMMKAKDIYKDISGDDEIIVQGVIDGFYVDENDNIVLFDYKSDKVVTSSADIAHKYKAQIDHYSKALENIMNKRVCERYLYLFDTDETIKM